MKELSIEDYQKELKDAIYKAYLYRSIAAEYRMARYPLEKAQNWYIFSAINVTFWAILCSFYLGRLT